MTNTLAWYKNP